jgi:hypothetical protein
MVKNLMETESLAIAKILVTSTPTDVATPEVPASSKPTGLGTAALSPRAPLPTNNFKAKTSRKEPQGSFLHIDVLSTTNSATLGIYP